MPAPLLTSAPPAPLRSENPATFNPRAEAFLTWMANAPDEFNALAEYMESLESGTLSALLAAISNAGSAANKLAYYTGPNAVALADLTAAGRALLDDPNAAAQRATLGLVIGTDVQAASANLNTFSGIAPSANVQSLLAAANYSAIKTLLALVVGTDVKAQNPSIQAITSTTTLTPAFGNDLVKVTAQAAALFVANWSGTPYGGWGMAMRFKDNGSARALSFDTKYRPIGVTLPTTTVAGKTLYLGCIYNSDVDKIDVVAVAQEG